jgi:hypothetical protein
VVPGWRVNAWIVERHETWKLAVKYVVYHLGVIPSSKNTCGRSEWLPPRAVSLLPLYCTVFLHCLYDERVNE